MRQIVALLLVAFCSPLLVHAQGSDYASIKAEAERLVAEKSYARARVVYERAKDTEHPPSEERWITFRLADLGWRAEAAGDTSDPTKINAARDTLGKLAADAPREEDRDRVWAEANESLGDFFWARRDTHDWAQAWPYYQKALDWWAGARDVDLARSRYLSIVWRAAEPPGRNTFERYGAYGPTLPIDALENALTVAQSDGDKARAHYLIAQTLQQAGDLAQMARIPEEYEAALKPGKSVPWYDEALYSYASFLTEGGRVTVDETGQWRREQDYAAALDLYRRLTTEFTRNETPFYEEALQAVDRISKPSLTVTVTNAFQLGAEIQYNVDWRNTARIDFALYAVDLTRDATFPERTTDVRGWIAAMPVGAKASLATWFKDVADAGDHRPGHDVMTLEQKLEQGAYILEARSDTITSRDVILVTDTALVIKTAGDKALGFVCNAIDGSPVGGARVAFWEQLYDSARQTTTWKRSEAVSEKDGVASVTLTKKDSGAVVAFASTDESQSFAASYSYRGSSSTQPWKIYVYTDRPAYRPGEEAQWKIVARQMADGQYSTPANRVVEFQVNDALGAKVSEGRSTLNDFGSAWGSLKLSESLPLGAYQISFWDEGRRTSIGSAVLFRLEEYKLPEFKVTVHTPEERGHKKAFLLGEKVEVSVDAEYYFGGAVANASAEVVVYQSPYFRYWGFDRRYPWLYAESDRGYYGRGQIIKRETITTDAEGHARISFDTPRSAQQDFQYTIEARVTDSSRREIVASDTVRVTKQRYYVYAEPDRSVVRPEDQAKIRIKSLDANEQPVSVEGKVTITRDYWTEVWIDPKGKEIRGDDLRKLREKYPTFPPPTKPNEKKWQIKSEGYEHEQISQQTMRTDADGSLEIPFMPNREGYYRFNWVSRDKNVAPIEANATIYAVRNETTELGYRSGGLEVFVDSSTAELGGTARVMIAAPPGLKAALLTVEGEDVYSHQVVRMSGTVKLVELQIADNFTPNVFVGAVAVSNGQMFVASTEIVVPPSKNFLNVEVKADKALYKPGDEGTLTVSTRDASGKPVAAEVGLSVADEAVYYIQDDLAGDPRKTFFGARRQNLAQTQSTFQSKPYARLLPKVPVAVSGGGSVATYFGGIGVADLSRNGRNSVDMATTPKGMVTTEVTLQGADANDRFARNPAEEPAVQVRTDFRATAFWQPDVHTGDDGTATVSVKFPESLTSWRATARVATTSSQFGIASSSARTRSPLTVRLQAPRFFVAGDTVTVAAIVNNNSDAVLTPRTLLKAQGVRVTGTVRRQPGGEGKVTPADGGGSEFVAPSTEISPGGELRCEWEVRVERPGDVMLQVETVGGEYGDAMERSFVAYEHGIDKLAAAATRSQGPEAVITIDIPAARQPRTTKLAVRVSPSLAASMLDAVPYLVDYPYGCTEQTMSRFMPAAVVAKTLTDQGVKLEDIEGRIFGPIDGASPPGSTAVEAATTASLADVEKAGLERLYEFQHADGGWGWWKDDESDHYMTAYVVWGLTLARKAGVGVRSDVLSKAADYLDDELVKEEKNYDVQAWMLHAVAAFHTAQGEEAGLDELSAFDNVYTNRDQLSSYTRALLAIVAFQFKLEDQTRVLKDNLMNGVAVDVTAVAAPATPTTPPAEGAAPVTQTIETAHWGESGGYWRWSDGAIEATAFSLSALIAIDPQNQLIVPAMNWLVKNRRGARWTNTRDTAFAVLALNDYLKSSGELGSDLEYELFVNGQSVVTQSVLRDGMFATPGLYPIENSLIRDGANEIRVVRRSGDGPIYVSAEARYFSLEEPIAAAGNELFVSRQYFKLVAQPTLLKGYYYERVPLKDGDALASGDRVETVLTIETKNDYEYLLFEDLKPAGLEAVDVRSGTSLYARQLTAAAAAATNRSGDASEYGAKQEWVYRELRDRKVALFATRLPQGMWEIRYELRAETPGAFHALPVTGQAMYVPEIRGNSVEGRMRVN